MHNIVVGLACLALTANGMRVQSRLEKDEVAESLNPSKAFATLLLASNPSSAFMPNTAAAGMHAPGFAGSRPMRISNGNLVMREPRTPVEIALQCLDDGCPANSVTEVLSALKAEENLDEEMMKLLKDLEAIYDPKEYRNKNEVAKILDDFANTWLWFLGSKPDSQTRGPVPNYLKEVVTVEKTTMEKAETCFKKGCSVDAVDELIAALEATPNKDISVKAAIQQLKAMNGKSGIDDLMTLLEDATIPR